MPRKFFDFLLASVLLAADVGQARFLEPDTVLIDQEERLSSETYNDKISYRFPTPWDHLWDDAIAGYRISAGSLNINRFQIVEEIKFLAQGDGPVSFSFSHLRQEDTAQERLSQVLRIDWLTPVPAINMAIMGEGGAKKEYGDLGLALGIKPRNDRLVEAYYWSVDHFYATKKQFAGDSRGEKTETVGWRGDWALSPQARLRFDHEDDKPFTWDRRSLEYSYTYQRRATNMRLDLGSREEFSGYASLALEAKEEGKVFHVAEGIGYEKSMVRDVSYFETAVSSRLAPAIVTTGLQTILRDVSYNFAAGENIEPTQYKEQPGPLSSKRREVGLFATSYFDTNKTLNSQLGLHLNHVTLDEGGGDESITEIKMQTAWDALINPMARIFLNLTWDIDQLQRDFPYTERQFRPWGGGNIQFLAVF